MAIIGKFTKSANGFEGNIETRQWNTEASLIKIGKKAQDKSPDYRVMAGRYEIGAAWIKTSEAGNAYISVTLDDPGFTAPINCRLHETNDGHDLVWQRS